MTVDSPTIHLTFEEAEKRDGYGGKTHIREVSQPGLDIRAGYTQLSKTLNSPPGIEILMPTADNVSIN